MGSRLDSHAFTVSYGRELKVMTTVNLFLCCSVFGKNFQANIVLLYSRQNIFILMVKEVFCFRKQMQWSIFTSGEKGELAHIKFGRFSIQKPELWVWQTNTGKEKGNQRQNKYLRNDSLQESETRRQGRWTPPRDTERIPAAVGEITVPRKHADRMIAWQRSRATPQKALQIHAGRWHAAENFQVHIRFWILQ